MKTPGQAAYEKWREKAQSQVSFTVNTWEQVGETSQKVWEEIAQAAIKKHQETCCCDCDA